MGFDYCVRVGLSEGKVRFLSDADGCVLRSLNGLRDAAQHYLLSLSEHHLYMQLQAGVTLFRDLYKKVFNRDLAAELPDRVLPISTTPSTDLATLFDDEMREVKRLLEPGKRHRTEAMAKLRAIAILNGAVLGKTDQPSPAALKKMGAEILGGKSWESIFTGAAGVSLSMLGKGPSIELRLTKSEGIAVHLVKEADATTPVIAVRRVNELGYYNLGRDDLADRVGLSGPMTSAMIWHLGLQADLDFYKEFVIGKTIHRRYSQRAISRIRDELNIVNQKDIWKPYQSRRQACKAG